jgi:multidrug efflux pump subunit AcrA (membrane-fusion protein)
VPKDSAAFLKPGTAIDLLNEDGSVLAKSKVFYISPTVDIQSQSVLIKGLCENNGNELRPDQSVLAKIVLNASRGITIPTEAITYLAGQSFVFVVVHDKSGKLIASQRPIEIVDIRDNRATVSSGLKSSDEIVVAGIQLLADGTAIKLQGAESVH